MAQVTATAKLKELETMVSRLESAVQDDNDLSELVERLTALTNTLNVYFEIADGE